MRDDFKSNLVTAGLSGLAAALLSSILVMTAVAADNDADAPLRQVKLTQQSIKGVIAAQPDLDAFAATFDTAEGSEAVTADETEKLEAIAKKHGFKSYEDLEAATFTAAFILEGVNPETGAFTEPRKLLEQELNDVKTDKDLDAEERKLLIEELSKAIEADPKVAYPEDIELITKNRKALLKVLE